MVTINHFQASKKNDKSQCSIYSGHKYYINGADISIHHNANYAKKLNLFPNKFLTCLCYLRLTMLCFE